jgi:hypothetical protein
MKGKQKQNSAIPHGVNAQAKVLAGIRWAHEYQVLAICLPVSLVGKRMREYALKAWQLLMPNRKHRKELKLPLSPDRLSRLEGVHQGLQLNLGKIRYI